MNIQFFICFHKKIFPKLYSSINETEFKYITYYGVKERIRRKNNVLYEDELPIYNPNLQKQKYNEGSCLYHVYKNNLYDKYDYIGFCQYDMIFHKNTFENIEQTISSQPNTIFYLNFFEWAFLGGQTAIIQDFPDFVGGLKSYNSFFNTNYTEDDLLRNKMNICNTFLIPKKMYEKMMSWLISYFKDDINTVNETGDGYDFNPGHMIEALTGMFLSLEINEGALYEKLDISHDHEYKM